MFLSSTAPDISEDMPTPLSGGGSRALAHSSDSRFEVSVNGLPFSLRVTPRTPYKRESEQVRKDQFDISGEPGEQSLAAWWIRSQSTWHLGAGIKYYDPGTTRETTGRYATSQGVDVWKQGEITLLNSMTEDTSSVLVDTTTHLSTFRSMGRDGWVVAEDTELQWRGGDAPGGTLVRENLSRNPLVTASGVSAPGWIGGPAGASSQVGPGDAPFGDVYRKYTTSASGTWSMSVGDRNGGTDANPVGPLEVDETVTASMYAQADWTGSATVDAVFSLNWYRADGSLAKTNDEILPLTNGAWLRLEQRQVRPEDAEYFRVTMRFESSGSIPSGGEARTGAVLLERGVDLSPWFSGASTDDSQHDYEWTGTANGSTSTDTYTPGTEQTMPSGSATQPAPVGGAVWVGRDGGISRWDVNADILTNPYTCTGVARCWWVKDRLVVAVGKELYWVDHLQVGTIPDGDINAHLIATGPDDTWEWVDVTDATDSILAAGSGETASSIFAMTIEDVEGVPTLSGAREVARLPQGEQATCMGAYISSFIVLGTTHGVRVGGLGQNGQVQLGGLSVELDEPTPDVTFFDRFAYLPVSRALPDGTSGVVRVDLSEEILGEQGATGLFPWAWDVYPGMSEADATSICLNGNTGKVVLAHGNKVHVATDDLLEEGYLDSGLIRYQTSELKDFQRVRLTGDIRGGTVRVDALIKGVPSSVYTYGLTTGLEGEAALNLPGGPLFDELAFRITLKRAGAFSPIVNTISVKSTPAVRKSRLLTYPLQVFDFESNRHGLSIGYEGFAIDRIQELEALENESAAVQVIDRRYNEAVVGTIETLGFAGLDPPDGDYDNDGGVLTMVVRVR